MTQFTLTRKLMGAPVTAHAICLPNGVQMTACGGMLPHIGAVSVADPPGNVTTQRFPPTRTAWYFPSLGGKQQSASATIVTGALMLLTLVDLS